MDGQSFQRQIQNIPPEQVYRFLHSREGGLRAREVEERLNEVGLNTLEETRRLVWLKSLGRQFTNFFSILLDISAGICFVADSIQPGEGMNILGWALLGVSILNALFSFVQEYRAERAMEALRKFLPQNVQVRRDGQEMQILAEQLVPGDVLSLSEGDKVPADARLIEVQDLIVNNAPLTGEAHPVRLSAEAQDTILTESINVLFAGCMVKKGRGQAVVFTTGGRTEFGKIATLSHEVKRNASPLERETGHMVRVLTYIAVTMGAIFFAYGVFTGRSLWVNLVFMMGIIVANVPEGLLPTFTLSLAMGSLRMAKRNVLVKGLNAVEALGAVHVICTDKTGTLTQNQMAITALNDPQTAEPLENALRSQALGMALAASDVGEGENGLRGDPLDVAVAEAFIADGGIFQAVNDATIKRFSFDDEKRRAGGVWRQADKTDYCVKGAWESLRPLMKRVALADGSVVDLDGERLAAAEDVVHKMASSGQRVIALAYRQLADASDGDATQEQLEQDLILKGFIGAEDPIRDEVPGAVAACHTAGIGVVMITGDHPETAEAIARRAGIVAADAPAGSATVTGAELSRLSKVQLVQKLKDGITVFARTTPEQKWKVVSAFHELNKVVAVTGDGVNDAPALKAADVGIAMGKSGTDVAREAAQVILLDDNFASIVNGIEEGRTIFNNIRKFTNYVLVSNGPEILPYLLYMLFPVPLAMTVIQILAIDLGTDIIPSMGLGQEKPDPEVMKQPPRDHKQGLLTFPLIAHSYLFLGLIEAAFALSLFFWVLFDGGWVWGADLSVRDPLYLSATGITLSSIILMQIGNLFGRRSRTGSGLSLDFLSNPLIVGGIVFEIVFSWAILYFPPLSTVLGTGPVDLSVYAVAWIGPFAIFALDYARKRVLAGLRARGMAIPSG
ncbi:cation-transporting P-type ATPase [Magnetovibrio sp.]|uniref:cation-translocating P-type ATPase n=1 Tax=Magnetovibrio sp. TaxID=2024836 RepID=UPI002F95F68B